MASISITVTDNEYGVINSSFNFSEGDIKRIQKALASIYRPNLEPPPIRNVLGEMVPQPYDPSPNEVFAMLAKSLVTHIVNTCQDEEVQQIINKAKMLNEPIQMRANER